MRAAARADADFSVLRPPWQAPRASRAADVDNDNDDDGGDRAFLGSVRLNSGDLALLKGDANSEEGLKLASLKDEISKIKAMKAPELQANCTKKNLPYGNSDKTTITLMKWVCAHYSFDLPRSWLPAKLARIGFPAEFEEGATAAAVETPHELGSGLSRAVALAARCVPFNPTRVRRASAVPESPSRIARRDAAGVGGASTLAANAIDSPPRRRRREDVERIAELEKEVKSTKELSTRELEERARER